MWRKQFLNKEDGMYATTTKGKILSGIFWGVFMFFFMFLVFPYHEPSHQYNWGEAPGYLLYWCTSGIILSYVTSYFISLVEKKNNSDRKNIQ